VRASRLVSLLLLLQTRGGMTARALADELEVSERTIYRDTDALSAAGVPIYAERGPHGGIRLVDGYRTRLTGMTPDEAEALFLSGLPGPAAELGLGTVVAAARLKVLAALPTELRGRATRLIERFHLDASGWYAADEPVPHLGAIAEAVWESHTITMVYDRGSRVVERRTDPLGLVLKAGTWYVIGRTDGQLRTYRVARVREVRATGERYARPPGFDLAAYWIESSAAYERDTPRVTVTIRVRPDAVTALADVVGRTAWQARETLESNDTAGWAHVRVDLEWPDEVPGRLLAMGSAAEVLAPPEIRAAVARRAARVVALYAGERVNDGEIAPGTGAEVG
jgi:predicted DNA-binding transcriptional regulator YafY